MSSEIQKYQNPFGKEIASSDETAISRAGQEREIQEVQAAMVIAKRFPRDERAATDKILNACARPGLAQSAVYSYAKGGTAIEGPSIRLAEAIAQAWGNIQFGIRETDQSNGKSIAEAFAWDIETNTRQVKVFQVPHIRHTKRGAYALTDPREIYETVANNGARRLRACILGIIPGDVVDSAVEQCSLTMQTHENITPDGIKKMLDAFEKFSVSKAQIEARIQRRMDAITPALMANLRKIYTSMKDGMSSADEWFEPTAKQPQPTGDKPRSQTLADTLKADSGEKEATPFETRTETENATAGNSASDTANEKPPTQAEIAAKLGVPGTVLTEYCTDQGWTRGSFQGVDAIRRNDLMNNAEKYKRDISAWLDDKDNE